MAKQDICIYGDNERETKKADEINIKLI